MYLAPDTTIGNFVVRITTFIFTTCPLQSTEPSEFVLSTLTQNLYLPISKGPCVFSSCLCQVLAGQFPLPRCCYCWRVNVLSRCHCRKVHENYHRVRIIYDFTYRIVSDKRFLWSVFWTNTQSGFFHVACGAQNITLLLWQYWYVARHGVRKAKWLTASEGGKSTAIKQTCALSPRSK